MSSLNDLLKSSPSYEDLRRALQAWLSIPALLKLSVHDAATARILVDQILISYWPLATDGDTVLKDLLVSSLASLSGINALLHHKQNPVSLSVLQEVLTSKELSLDCVYQCCFDRNSKHRNPNLSASRIDLKQVWAQYVRLLASGRIIGHAAELRASTALSTDTMAQIWLDDRNSYTHYLAGQVIQAIQSGDGPADENRAISFAAFLDQSSSTGIVSVLVSDLFVHKLLTIPYLECLGIIISHTSSVTQAKLLVEALRHLDVAYLHSSRGICRTRDFERDSNRIGAVATTLKLLLRPTLLRQGCHILLHDSVLLSLSMRRAIVLVLPEAEVVSASVDSLAIWADAMYIKHTPVLAQEALTETILLLCAYAPAEHLFKLSKGKSFTEGISNRLASTSDRLRFLGMIVGETISEQVVADEKKRLTFGVPETQTEEAKYWRDLIGMTDKYQELTQLEAGFVEVPDVVLMSSTSSKSDPVIQELVDHISESSDEDEFVAKRVPDSDDEDSDEDPTLVDRERLRQPVYIRDLIAMLNKHDSYKHILLALKSAPALIRRKAGYGTEVQDYAIHLAQLLSGMRDNFDIDDFQTLRQDGLRALTVVCPTVVTPYLCETFFTGDYSLQQRVIILSAIGLGSRELAGAIDVAPEFLKLTASKQLPPAIARQYETISGLSAVAQEQILAPIASDATESLSGPAALKVQKTTRRTVAVKPQKVANKLTPVVAEYVLFPLLGLFQIHAGKMIDKDAVSFYEASLLSYYIRTISLVYQVSTASTAFARLTSEFWELVLSLRTQDDHSVIESLLFAILILIDANDDRRLASEYARKLVETQEWVSAIFERVKEQKIQVLAAGILIRIRDVVEKHQVMMMQSITSVGNIGRGRFGIAGLK